MKKMCPPSNEYWFRYENGSVDEGGKLCFYPMSFQVIRNTPKGVWLAMDKNVWEPPQYREKRFVLLSTNKLNAGKRFAYPTDEQALFSYKRRNAIYIGILKTRLEKAERIRWALHTEGGYRDRQANRPVDKFLLSSGSNHRTNTLDVLDDQT
jgi:hypothetical protein